MSMDEATTIKRLQRLRQGTTDPSHTLDADANLLFERHRGALRAYCRAKLGDPNRADEVVNEVFLVAWRRLDAFDFSASFQGWLFGIARFTCMRAREKRRELLIDDGILDPADPAAQVWRLASRQQRTSLLMAAIEDLDSREQDAIVLRYFQGYPVARITEELGLTTRTGARGLLQQCTRHLRKRLRELAEEHELRTSFWLTAS